MIDTSNLNTIWGSLLVEELVRQGVELFCISPGSRSTPLTAAVARNPRARSVVCLDERGAAFYALGYGRATGRPAAVICTSGTAVANFLPAAVEAHVDGVPLLLISADRPPELRQTLANQTIEQPGLFGRYANWQFDLPAPTAEIALQFVLTTVAQAVYRATRAPAGPVHLNCMFREPLAPVPAPVPEGYLAPLDDWRQSGQPFTRYLPTAAAPNPADAQALHAMIAATTRGLLIIGQLKTAAERAAAEQFARRLNWPAFPDITSGLRLGRPDAPFVAHYDLALLSTEAADRPDGVIHIGGQFVSKRLLTFLQSAQPAQHVVIRPDPLRYDPHHHVTLRIEADLPTFLSTTIHNLPAIIHSDGAWAARWQAKQNRVAAVLAARDAADWCEADLARALAALLPADWTLFLGSSMPIRDVDQFASAAGAPVPVAANRGASGIDGTLACAAGWAAGAQRPTVLLVGDLTLLHDLNALLLIARSPQPIVVVLVNNQGGGIFHFLPVAAFDDLFEPFFGTPHTVQFGPLATGFGLPYTCVADGAAFEAAFRQALRDGRSAVIEVQTERRANHAAHLALQAQIAARLRGAA